MCYRTECVVCHKPTWAGCGKHIEEALQGVSPENRCQCDQKELDNDQAAIVPQDMISTTSAPPQENALTLMKSLSGHTDRVWCIALHPTMPLIATASSDKTVRLYSKIDYHYIATIEGNHSRSVRACAWKPREAKPILATASFDGTAGIWDCQDETDTDLREWECAGLLEGHENEVKCVAWSASGTLLATCSRDKSIWIWECENYEDPECLSVMQEHNQDVKCVVWHPEEELLASGSYDDDIRLWRDDGDDWTCCATLKGHTGTVWAVAFEDSSLYRTAGNHQARLVSASGDSTVRIWHRSRDGESPIAEKGAIPSIIRPSGDQIWDLECILPKMHDGDIYTVAWSPYSGTIATSGQDGNIVIYNREPIMTGKQDATNDTWSVTAQKSNAHGVHEINHLVWGTSAEGGEILLSAGDDGQVNIWEFSTRQPV